MSTAVMPLGSLQQHRALVQPAKKMVMMLSPPQDHPQIVQPSNGACVIVSANGAYSPPPHFTNLDGGNNNNNAKAKNNNNKVSRVNGGAVQKATPRTSVVVSAAPALSAAAAADALRCKRRIQFTGAGAATFGGHQTASVQRRNARERNRVKQVNNGFATLRSHIPPAIAAALQEQSPPPCEPRPSGRQSAKDKEAAKKLSKVETLRMAVEYIRRLQLLLNETGANNENADPVSPVNVKTESVLMPDSPHDGYDADYETALALSQYSMASTPSTASHPVTSSVGTLVNLGTGHHHSHHHHHQQHPQHQQQHFVSMSPPCSDAGSAGSPTPSYVSDGSAGASSTGYAPPTFVAHGGTHHLRPTHLGHPPATPPDSTVYEPMSPEDEELLDVISWWQQSN